MAFQILTAICLSLYFLNGWRSEAHVFRTGICPNLDVVENFNYDKFQGKWFAIEKSQTTSTCLKYIFTQNNGSKQVQEKYRPFGIKIFDWNDFSQIGPLAVPDSSVPAKMTVQFPFSMNPFTPNSFWVVATDYETYASMWSCRPFIFGHFQSAMILSRNRTLDRDIINKLRSKFDYYGVDKNDFSAIDQQDCNEIDFNPQISDEDIKNLFVGIGIKSNSTVKPTTVVNQTNVTPQSSLTTKTSATENSENDILS